MNTKKISMIIGDTEIDITADHFSDDEIGVISRFISAVSNEAKAKSLQFDARIAKTSEWHSGYDFSKLVAIKDKVDSILLSRINCYANFEINSNCNLPLDVAARLTTGAIFDEDKVDELMESYETDIIKISHSQAKASQYIDFGTRCIGLIPDTINNLLTNYLDPDIKNIWVGR